MLISSENEQISVPLDDATESLSLSLFGENQVHLVGLLLESELRASPSPPPLAAAIFTDVNVIPEHGKNELEKAILNLEGEIAQLRQKERVLNQKRREALNRILEIKGSIRVFCRVRPFLPAEKRTKEPISVNSEKVKIRSVGNRKEYKFDKVFDRTATQEDVFVEVEPILISALDGHNACIFAYGQTGTGKTFTMDGKDDEPGIIPRALDKLFSHASLEKSSSVTFSMSMLEVYMGGLRDLLAPKVACRTYEAAAKCNLNIQTDPKGMVEIEGLTEVEIPDFAKAKWWYSKGRRARSTSWTNVNEMSSRSHCLMKITISRHGDDLKAKAAEVSKLWMVDLGGSERLLKTGATGQTLDEGRAINLSLSALGDVVAALRRKRGHVPYRNSKLTQILKDSLGNSSKVLMLVHISPNEEDVGETICSLMLATRARAVETDRELAEDVSKQKQKRILELEEDMRQAKEECHKVQGQVHKAELLLTESKKLFFETYYQPPEDKEQTPETPQNDSKEINRAPTREDKENKRKMNTSQPRFMISTVASRQRQSAVEKDVIGRVRHAKSWNRSSLQFSSSQSEVRLKSILRESNKKSRYGEAKPPLIESSKCSGLDLKAACFGRMVTLSDPNFRTTLSHHRRMSDLI